VFNSNKKLIQIKVFPQGACFLYVPCVYIKAPIAETRWPRETTTLFNVIIRFIPKNKRPI